MKWIAVISYQSWSSCGQDATMRHPVYAPTQEGALTLAKDYFGSNIYGTLTGLYVQPARCTCSGLVAPPKEHNPSCEAK
jgi:hypothetical protein